jgi:hypothetical protein
MNIARIEVAKASNLAISMALRETRHSSEVDLVRQELVNLINLRHPRVQLAQMVVTADRNLVA